MSKLLKKYDLKQLLPPEYGVIVIDGLKVYIDPDDWPWIIQLHWKIKYNNKTPYATRKINRQGKTKTLRMHREIMRTPVDMDTHHKNGNSLDNRKVNLQNCTKIEHRMIQKTLF